MKLNIRTVPQCEHRFTTIGDWWERDGTLEVRISYLPDWRWQIGVLVHELVEWIYCKRRGITSDECDRFDRFYEEQYRSKVIPVEKEAGYDKRCPYHRGHVWGDRIAWLVEWLLGVDQKARRKHTAPLLNEKL